MNVKERKFYNEMLYSANITKSIWAIINQSNNRKEGENISTLIYTII